MDKESVSLSSEISVTGLLTLSKILLSANIVFVSCHLTTFGSGGVAYAKIYIYNWVFLSIDPFTVISVSVLFWGNRT